MEVFVYLIERFTTDGRMKILVEDWDTVCECLSNFDGTSDSVHIFRMPICRKDK